MKNNLKKFRVSLAVSVPMNYEGQEIEAANAQEAAKILIEDFRNARELGEFDELGGMWDEAKECFDEPDEESQEQLNREQLFDRGIYCEEVDEESDVASGVQNHQD